MHRLILFEVEEAILQSKNRTPTLDVEELRKFLRYFGFALHPDNVLATSLDSKRQAWRRFQQEAEAQNVLFELKNCSSYYALLRELLVLHKDPTVTEIAASESKPAEQLIFDFEKPKSA